MVVIGMRGLLLGVALVLLSGCQSVEPRLALVQPYRPQNYRVARTADWEDVNRVVLLPISSNCRCPELSSVEDRFDETILSELVKARGFQVVPVSRRELNAHYGKRNWSPGESIPSDFFDFMKSSYAADAVAFVGLTEYQSFPQLILGWHGSIVATESKTLLWEINEVFDSGDREVAAAAERYAFRSLMGAKSAGLVASVLNSPSQYAQFTLDAIFRTLGRFLLPL